MKIISIALVLALAVACATASPLGKAQLLRQKALKPTQKVVPLEEDASEAVNVATDAAIKSAKKSTKRAIENVARGGAPAVADEHEMDREEASMVQSLTGDTNVAGPASASGTGSTGSASGSTGNTGSTGSTGATGSSRLWFFAPACNGRGSLHTEKNKCICHKKHGGNQCEFKKLRTGAYNHDLRKVESHGRYVGVSKCKNGTPMGENDCVCFPGYSGYHCDQKECRNGKMVCAGGVKYCQKSTVCRCDFGWTGASCDRPIVATGNTGGTGMTGMSGSTGSASTGPAAMKSIRYKRNSKPAYKRTSKEMKDSVINEVEDRMPAKVDPDMAKKMVDMLKK